MQTSAEQSPSMLFSKLLPEVLILIYIKALRGDGESMYIVRKMNNRLGHLRYKKWSNVRD